MNDIRNALKELALPVPLGDRVKTAIDRAARESGLSYARARQIWYGEARRIEAHEAEQIQRALNRKHTKVARNELHELKARIARLETLLRATDEDFHSETLAALGHSTLRTD